MGVERILLPVSGRDDYEAAAQTAFVLAARYGAQVEGLHPATPPVDRFVVQDEAGAAMQYQRLLEQAKAQAEKDKQTAKERFARLAQANTGIKTLFRSMEGDAGDIVGHCGRFADLTVVPKAAKKQTVFWSIVREAALFASGRPVIIAPDKKIPAQTGDTIVIAWKESVESARAVSAAMPLFGKAKAVHMVSVGNDRQAARSLAEAKKYVALHFPKVTAKLLKDRKDIAATILSEAALQKNPLLVMGSYSQWRWKEWVFGGVTEFMINETKLPVLMAH
ncbi:MAG: universal stress protein [Hyphomicrobiales bacterium]